VASRAAQGHRDGIVGAYGGLVYLSTVLGGWIADRLRWMCGHIALAILPGWSLSRSAPAR